LNTDESQSPVPRRENEHNQELAWEKNEISTFKIYRKKSQKNLLWAS
jgi:hypothetical protein